MKPGFVGSATSAVAAILILFSCRGGTEPAQEAPQAPQSQQTTRSYLGFDRNIYPGDDAMKALRHDFAFSGYWLSPPPGEKTGAWTGKREFLRSLGFGFLVLYSGREDRELKSPENAKSLGEADARAAAEAAKREGFPVNAIIFLDMEEGGRLSPSYRSYIQSWLWTLTSIDYRGGFYCSAISVKEGAHASITTADDITDFLAGKSRPFTIWAYNEACPPSPGCTFPATAPSPKLSRSSIADVWQYVRSPRTEFAAHCPAGYHTDGNCYAPGDTGHAWFLDLNAANSADPSAGAGPQK